MKHHLIAPVLAALLIGCGPGLVDARFAVNRAEESFAKLEPALEKERVVAGDACFQASPPGSPDVRPCLDAVRARWKPIEAAAVAAYAAIVAALAIVGVAEAAAAVGRAPAVGQVLAVVVRALDAAEKLRVAVEAAHRDVKPDNAIGP